MTAIIQIQNIDKSYRDAGRERVVLKSFSLSVPYNTSLAIIGRSGTGKSTLLNLTSGIDIPDAGEIMVKDQNLIAMTETQRTYFRRMHIGFVFQSFNLIPSLTVEENLLLPLELSGNITAMKPNAAVEARLTDVDLLDRKNSYPEQLSGGEQQRVAIARAIIHQPDLILADEPTGNLDETNSRKVLNLLFDLVKREGKTLIIVTHSPEIAAMADSVLNLSDLR